MLLKNETGKRIRPYCILDRDYHTDAEIVARRREAKERDVQLKIWNKKELENYLVSPVAIARIINARAGRDAVTRKDIDAQIDVICDELKDALSDQLASEIFAHEKRGLTPANTKARGLVAAAWATRNGRRSIVSGKTLLLRLAEWSRDQCGVSFGPDDIAAAMTPDEIPREVAEVLRAVSAGTNFPR